MIALTILIQWLMARGKFMFLDNVVRNRAEVKELWRKFKSLANSFFKCQLVLMIVSLAISLVIILVCLIIAWPDITGKVFGTNAIIAIITFVILIIVMAVSFGIINALLKNFCVPIMYRKNIKILEAIEIFKSEFAPGHIFDIIRFFLMKLLIGLAIGIIIILCCCLTCCIAGCLFAIPYIGSVLLLPFIMFSRCYSLFFLEQFGDEWLFFEYQKEITEEN